MARRIKRAPDWAPLSSEARSLIDEGERDGLAWGYVCLADGEAAQRCVFGVASRPPDLFTISEGVEPPSSSDHQGDLFRTSKDMDALSVGLSK